MKNSYKVLLYSLFILVSCNDHSDIVEFTSSHDFVPTGSKSGKGALYKGMKSGLWIYNDKDSIYWKVHIDEQKSVKSIYPDNWNIESSPEYMFGASSPSLSNKDYLVFLKTDKKTLNLDLNGYCETMIFAMKNELNTSTSLTGYNKFKMSFLEYAAFFVIFEVDIENTSYMYFTFYLDDEKDIFDFTYRFEVIQDVSLNEIIFWEFVNEFQLSDLPVFSRENRNVLKIESVE